MFNLRNLIDDQRGNVIAIGAAAVVVFASLIGSALDLSVAYMARGKLQNACDAGVLAARQSMTGTDFNDDVRDEANKFFDFNFPDGTADASDVTFNIGQSDSDRGELTGSASAVIPTSIVRILGISSVPVGVNCDATQDMGHNDIVLVLDVTGSMNAVPSSGGSERKIERLRNGAAGLYRAMETDDGSRTRFGIVPYSHTVNVARSLRNNDILRVQKHTDGEYQYTYCDTDGRYIWNCQTRTSDNPPRQGFYEGGSKYLYNVRFDYQGERDVHINDSSWSAANGFTGFKSGYRTSGDGCIEERPTIDPGNPAPSGEFIIRNYVTQADIDQASPDATNNDLQFGRYDPGIQKGQSQVGCPSEASRLREYDDETAYQTAINDATANVTGGTYHDVGMLWGTRFASRTGWFTGEDYDAGDNATQIDTIPVNTHIVFMTDGILDTGNTLYSAHGVEAYQDRTRGTGSQDERHLARFVATCSRAKQMGITIWVIALDVTSTDDIRPCATSASQFFTSDGSDLEEIFEAIGQGIGNLRLTR